MQIRFDSTFSRFILPLILLGMLALPIGCSHKLDGPQPSADEPVLDADLPVQPGLICRMQHPAEGTEVKVVGSHFSPMAYDIPNDPKTALPALSLRRTFDLDGSQAPGGTITFGGKPGETNARLLRWYSQSEMGFLIHQNITLADGTEGMLDAGIYDLTIENPNGLITDVQKSFAVVDRPFVQRVEPAITCVSEEAQGFIITGLNALRVAALEAEVQISGATFAPDPLGSCTTIAHPGIDAETCKTIDFTIPKDGLSEGLYDVTVQNPETAACNSVPTEDNVQLRVVLPPWIDSVDPALICVEDEQREIIISGTGFLEIESTLPTVTLDGVAMTLAANALSNCTDASVGSVVTAQSCETITLTVPATSLATGNTTVVVQNPAPAACSVSNGAVLTVPPPLTLVNAAPAEMCQNVGGLTDIIVEGTGFLKIGDQDFTVLFGGVDAIPTAITDCSSLTVDGLTVQSCDTFTLSVDLTTLPAGDVEVTVTNPEPSGCGKSVTGLFD
ncbi:hypothetical protein KAI87_09990, partial [Myxococcota bacterium]|nr:hypothetical protein [Myxococcota bacterium]